MIEDRPYQPRTVDACRQQYRDGSRAILLVAPTGSGKTIMAKMMADRAIERGRVGWIVHRQELVDQAVETLPGGVTVLTIQGMLASGRYPPFDILFLDEAHHYVADLWGDGVNHYRDTLKIGLTATPERGDGRALGDLFTSMVVSASYSELIAGGWLVDCEVIAPPKQGNTLAMPAAEAVEKYSDGRQSIAFCSTVAEATDSAGLFGAVVSAKTPTDLRKDIIRRFRDGEIKTLYNVNVLTEGFDAPAAAVCVLARGVGHVSTMLQMCGRVLRPAPGKSIATIVDLTGVVHKHGWPTEDREYSLEGRAIRRSDKAPAIWQCKRCGMCLVKPPADRRCPVCKGEMSEPTAIRVAREKMEKLKRQAVFAVSGRGAEYAAIVEEGKAKGYKPGWAKVTFKRKFGYWPRG